MDLCLHLQASLESAFRRRQVGLAIQSQEWGEAFLQAFDRLPEEDALDIEMVYLIASKTLAVQAMYGLDRPLAHRILADPEAFLMSLLCALRKLEFKF